MGALPPRWWPEAPFRAVPVPVPVSERTAPLRELESALDQCWDLLRRRRAKSEFGENPDDARVRSASQVEGYRS
ncbi:DUF2630 family protein [Streptomyces galilaeus]|nr:DUF2630 family protein [Streptomyces galilaeus]GGW59752.1 hypothetical protein GCM10010350_50330 [Streptomyces galilaeus]